MAFKAKLIDAARAADYIVIDERLMEECNLVVDRLLFEAPDMQGESRRYECDPNEEILIDTEGVALAHDIATRVPIQLQFLQGIPINRAVVQAKSVEAQHG